MHVSETNSGVLNICNLSVHVRPCLRACLQECVFEFGLPPPMCLPSSSCIAKPSWRLVAKAACWKSKADHWLGSEQKGSKVPLHWNTHESCLDVSIWLMFIAYPESPKLQAIFSFQHSPKNLRRVLEARKRGAFLLYFACG